ncbi:hypothetical protein ACTMTI_49065 [Nonomuraea sp. H19]|uniref:hypothetical protein n=1 Tax=Nonomuraea sp. H19 TaxID=3452206 RepID=UPI003F8AEF07
MSLLDLEKRLAQAASQSYEGPDPAVTLAEAWKVGATIADLSVHAIGCRWIGQQQGMVKDRFHILQAIPESDLAEMTKHAEIDERCLCRRPQQERLFAQPTPRTSRRKPRTPTNQAQGITLTVDRGDGAEPLVLEGVQLAQRDPLDPEDPYMEADPELRHVASVVDHGLRQYHGLGRTPEEAIERLRLFLAGEQIPGTIFRTLGW